MMMQTTQSGLLVPLPEPQKTSIDEQLESRRAMLERYRRDHACCPECSGVRHETTCVGHIGAPHVDRNRSTCLDCGWKGIVHQRVSLEFGTAIMLRRMLRSWDLSTRRWQENHESIPAAFLPLANAMERASRLLDAMVPSEDQPHDDR